MGSEQSAYHQAMRRNTRSLLFVILLIVAGNVTAQTVSNAPANDQIETVQFHSRLVKALLPYGVVLPTEYKSPTARLVRYPVIYLLHAYTGHYSSWHKNPDVAAWANRYRVIIVTPEGNEGWYTDSATVPTNKYESYVVKELIPDVDRRYRTVASRQGRSIAGFSMGGFGAVKFAVKYPATFVFAASLAGGMDLASITETRLNELGRVGRSIAAAFGPMDSATRSANDLFGILNKLTAAAAARVPYLYIACGDKDSTVESNRNFIELLSRLHIAHEYHELSGGHDLAIFRDRVPEVMKIAARKMTLIDPADASKTN